MDDVIYVFSSPATRILSPPADLGVVVITDSEPEDLDKDDILWKGRRKETTQIDPSSHRRKDCVKEDSPMNTDAPTAQAGPSSHSPAPISFPDAPVVHIQPDPQEEDVDPYSEHLSLVVEVIPDILPQYALEMIKTNYPTHGNKVGEWVVQSLFDNSSYPKAEKVEAGKQKGKRKASELEDVAEGPLLRVKIDYTTVDRPRPTGKNYRELSTSQLYTDFPYIPVKYVRRAFASNNGLYTPTHLQLAADLKSDSPPFKLKTIKSNISVGKGKQKEIQDEDFEKERAHLLLEDIQAIQEVPDTDKSRDAGTFVTGLNVPPEDEGCLECGCCFSPAPFDNMIQCPDAHLFCTECMGAYASNLLGEHNFRIVCMDQSGCKLPFPESELKRFLTPKLLLLYEKIRQAKEIEMAGLDGLEECPHCDFKVVIDNPDERLFRCQNEDCGAVTCRECKKPDHLPKSCVEVNEDKRIDARHVVEEAMTSALLRNCPNCNKVFIKESGCNKMTCPNCKTLSCYICRQIITGYDHFNDSRSGQPQQPGKAGKCKLWDKVEERHEKEVEDAQKRAIAEYRKEHPDMGEDALRVEQPKVKGKSQTPAHHPPAHRPFVFGPIEPLPPALDHRLPFITALREERFRNPGGNLPQLPPNIPQFDPFVGVPHLPAVPAALQQQVIAGRIAERNLWNKCPAMPPNVPIPRPQENKAGGARTGPPDRRRANQLRRMDGAAL